MSHHFWWDSPLTPPMSVSPILFLSLGRFLSFLNTLSYFCLFLHLFKFSFVQIWAPFFTALLSVPHDFVFSPSAISVRLASIAVGDHWSF